MSFLRIAALVVLAAGCTSAQPPPPTAPPPEPMAVVPLSEPQSTPVADSPPDAPEPEPEPPPSPANSTESGLQWDVIRHGTGRDRATLNDSVTVHYEGWTTDGNRFDSSLARGKPATFGVTKVIAGWTEVLQLMVMGDKWRVTIPADLAYGATPSRPGAPAGDLTFEIEIIDIVKGPEVPPTVAAAPANAIVTASGLAYRRLEKGGGMLHPQATDRVEVHYSGWTTDGKMFDSSVTRGQPAQFTLTGVIKGWTEGLQLMTEGDRFRFWIPPDLAYGTTPKRPGAPAGMLVFDVELLRINP